MAKITRKHQKIFAGDVPETGVVATFGSLKAATPVYSTDLDVLQGLTAWGAGWGSAVINSYAPAIQDFNSVFNVITKQLAYIFQNGVPYWNASVAYYIGSIVSDDAGTLYLSMSDTNLNVALTDNTKWLNFCSNKITTVTALDYTVLNSDWYIRINVTPDVTNHQVILPVARAELAGREIIVKSLAANNDYRTHVIVSGGATIDGAAYVEILRFGVANFICSGVIWEQSL
jgi:hypothetical protein